MVDLADAADKKIGAYSKGMRQRIKMAQALAHDPELLILDEPLAGMDPIARRETIRLIKEWGRAGRSVVVSSHILHEIESMTSNILLINQGRILAEGNVHQIRDLIDEHPHTVHVKADETRALARALLADDDVLSLKFEERRGGRPDRPPRCVLRAADRHRRIGRARRDSRGHVARRQPAGGVQVSGEVMADVADRTARPALLHRRSASSICRSARCCGRGVRSSWRCSRAAPVLLAGADSVRRRSPSRRRCRRSTAHGSDGPALFGLMIWLLVHPVHRAGAGRCSTARR